MQSNFSLFLMAALILLAFVGFTELYYRIYKWGFNRVIEYNGHRITENNPVPTFFISSDYNSRLVVKAADELRAPIRPDGAKPLSWGYFNLNNDEMSDAKKENDNNMHSWFADLSLRGLTVEKLVEQLFREYGDVEYEFWVNNGQKKQNYKVNENLEQFVLRVVNEGILEKESAVALQKRTADYFEKKNRDYLGNVSTDIKIFLDEVSAKSNDAVKLKSYYYSAVVSGLSSGSLIYYDKLREELTRSDFLYFAITGGGDIQPLSEGSRLAHMLQIIIIGALLAGFTAVATARFL